MMDGKAVRQKLIGSDDQRAVSPVIGVILMVAITVILAAVIAAFVLDMGSGMEETAQAGVSISDDETTEVTFEITSMSGADGVAIVHDGSMIDAEGTDWTVNGPNGDDAYASGTGSTISIQYAGGSNADISAVAYFGDDGTDGSRSGESVAASGTVVASGG